jgi:hypothetical protein
MSTEAIVCRIITRKHPNADRLVIGECAGYQIVTGVDTTDGQLGVYFPSGSQLSSEFCFENSAYRLHSLNKDQQKSGYFEPNRRVKAIKLRGARSEGYWVPVQSLEWTGVALSELTEGFTFTTLNGKPICDKYYTPATQKAMQNKQQKAFKKLSVPMFKEHFDTKHLRTSPSIPSGATIRIFEKLHGTSGRTSHALVKKQLSKFQQFWNKYLSGTGLSFKEEEWLHVSGTRHVVMDPYTGSSKNPYYKPNFRQHIHKSMSLRKGETVYYEIVGYEGLSSAEDGHGHGTLIMPSQTISVEKNDEAARELRNQFGNCMTYTYGCKEGEYKVYVYRITQTNVDAETVELSWPQVVARCRELGLETVPELGGAMFYDQNATNSSEKLNKQTLLQRCRSLSEGVSVLDQKHIKEGVCVRVESESSFTYYKYKSFYFDYLEGRARNDDSFVDPEEIS